MNKEIAVFGGGCFWCTEAIFKMLKGVSSVLPGYSGGVEVVRIEFDSRVITFETLLTVFFATHDPTSWDKQNHDVGPQYRSAVFYSTEEQKEKTESFIRDVNASNLKGKSIVTTVEPLREFREAEDYHKDFYAQNTEAPYCQIIINPKLEKVKQKFAALLKERTG